MPPPPRTITLYAPSIDRTIQDFTLRSKASYTTTLRDMRTALGNITQAYPYDLKKAPIHDFTAIESGKTILIGTDYFETPLDDKHRDVFIVQSGAAAKAWMTLIPNQRRDCVLAHISKYLKSTKTTQPVYLTLPLASAKLLMSTLSSAPPTASSSLAIIAANWSLPLDAILGFQGMVAPYGAVEDWDGKLLAALALLSEALVAQEMVASRLILDRVGDRGHGALVGWEEVVEVGRELYGRVS